jgi:hypothetical protein
MKRRSRWSLLLTLTWLVAGCDSAITSIAVADGGAGNAGGDAAGGQTGGSGGMAGTSDGGTDAAPGGSGGGTGELPGPTNTGVPAGTILTPQNGDLHVTQAGAVVDALDIRGCVYVEAPNVTIRRSKISGCMGVHTTVIRNGNNPVVVEDVEIDGGASDANVDLAAVGFTQVTCLRCNLHGLSKGANVGGVYDIEYSWIHDLYMPGAESQSPHGEGLYCPSTQHGIIRGNNFDSRNLAGTPNNSGAIAIYNDDTQDDLLIDSNLLNADDAAICMYVGYTHSATNAVTNVRVQHNRFGRKYHATCASWQPVWSAGGYAPMDWGSANGNQWIDNTYVDGTVVDPPY